VRIKKGINRMTKSTIKPLTPVAIRLATVCLLLGISESTFYRVVKSGALKTVKVSKGCTAVLQTELDRYLAAIDAE